MNRPSYPLTLRAAVRPDSCSASLLFTRGLTVIELLVAIAVLAVLAGVGAPALSSVADSMRLSATSNGFLSALHLARSEAIKRNGRVVLCKSADGLSCTASGGWQQGWLVFHDANNDAGLDNGETVIQRAGALHPSLRFTGNMNVASYVSFIATGATKLVNGGFQAGTFTLCRQSAAGGAARWVVLNAVGRPRVERVKVDACV